ncbi:mandelate racemase [Kribbella turkmenica]|uniref:Mandelate racemase n=1 Tax=Kribbella turkmenica TaxID=2530375 RepID=A0A4R4X8K8_9ACTN|nr:enolase C-terminal domain-like protein [Kribbella turkmenica]TDD26821.1 mandelate racemase [Kribbella turkmenica]
MTSLETAIDRIDVFSYDLSYAHGRYVMSKDRVITTLPSTVVRVRTRGGLTGYGESCPLGPAYLPGFAAGVRAVLAELAPQLIGQDALNLSRLNATMDMALSGHDYAKASLDIACWDILGRSTGLPVATLLGGVHQERFPLYIAVPHGDPAEMADFVRIQRENGLRRFQLKLGGQPVDDAERARAIVDATGDDDLVIADANGGWRLQSATIAARLLEPLPRLILEQPCPTLEECLAVRQRTTLPMVLDECITDVQTLMHAYSNNGLDGMNLKISRVGGLTKARLLRDLGATLGLRLTIEDTWGGDLTTAAVSHLAASTPQDALLHASFMNDWTTEHIAEYQPRSADGYGNVPSSPGLGVEVDEDMLGAPVFSVVASDGCGP